MEPTAYAPSITAHRRSSAANAPEPARAAGGAEAPALWRRLAPLAYAEQLQAAELDPRLRSPDLCRHLHRLSEQAADGAACTAAQLANLALRIAAHLDDDRCDRARASDLRALGHAHLGN